MAFYSVSQVGGGLGNIPFQAGDFVFWVDSRIAYFVIKAGNGGNAILVPVEQILSSLGVTNAPVVGAGVYSVQKDANGVLSFVSAGGGSSFVFQQSTPLDVWVINHGLNTHPAVVVEDSTGRRVEGDIVYTDNNSLTITFSAPFSGMATLV